MMNTSILNVPVRIKIWCRPECQRKQFDVIKKVKPSVLFVLSDGGRNEDEWEKIRINRKMIDDEIDWDCDVYKQYWDKNIGLYSAGKAMSKLIWDKVDRCILLEDDILPSESFFYFCAEMLERYKDDERISVICGMNHLGKYDKPSSDYFFSRQASIWGTAIWKRTYLSYGIEYRDDKYVINGLKKLMKRDKNLQNRMLGYAKNELYDGHIPGNEFGNEFAVYGYNQLQIVPKVNLVSNIGCTADAAHSDSYEMLPRLERKHFNMPIYEMEFPLKHPRYVFPDEYYEKQRNKIMMYNHPFLRFLSKIDRFFILLKKGKIKHIMNKIISRHKKKIES